MMLDGGSDSGGGGVGAQTRQRAPAAVGAPPVDGAEVAAGRRAPEAELSSLAPRSGHAAVATARERVRITLISIQIYEHSARGPFADATLARVCPRRVAA